MQSEQQNETYDQMIAKEQAREFQFVVPSQYKGLRACNNCGLIKSKTQWERASSCQNCGIFEETKQTTNNNFFGMIGIINPKESFIRKKARIYAKGGNKLKSAVYGI